MSDNPVRKRMEQEIKSRRNRLIRELREEGYFITDIARVFSVNHGTISRLVKKK